VGEALHGVEVVEGDEAVGVLGVVLAAFAAADLKGVLACFKEAHECAFLLVLLAGNIGTGLLRRYFHRTLIIKYSINER
jgi:hypothetical protein